MTLLTITFDDSTHKLVPREPTEIQIQQGCISQTIGNFASYEEWWNAHSSGVSQRIRHLIAKYYRYMIAAAPEYQEPEHLCDDGGKCGAGGYCNNCAAPDNQIAKQAERYEKVRKLDVRQLAEIFRMNIQEGIPFDELIDGACIFTAQDIGKDE